MTRILLFLFVLSLIAIACNTGPKPKDEKSQEPVATLPNVSHVKHPDWSKNATMYEVNIRQFTPEGTLKAFTTHLPRLKNMGVNVLWLMPIHPIGKVNRKGTLGSYYSVQDYIAINPEFGTLKDFQQMVDLAHDLGMKVILDWVANHTSWDHAWVKAHPEFYDLDSSGVMYAPFGWEDVVQLDYEKKELWKAMTSELEFWVRNYDIDGYRCDVAGMVPTAFWNQARTSLDKIKPVFMLAEAEKPELLVDAFDMDYGWHFHHLSNLIAKGDTTADVIPRYFEELKTTLPKGAYKMNFSTNHDENSWNGTTYERYGEGYKTFAVLMATVPGMPMVYTGQEAGNTKRLKFFEKDAVEWNGYPLEDFYRILLNLNKRNQALWNGEFGGDFVPVKTTKDEQVLAFTRSKDDQRIFVILNLSGEEQQVVLSGQKFVGEYNDVFDFKTVTFIENHELKLKPWAYRVYEK